MIILSQFSFHIKQTPKPQMMETQADETNHKRIFNFSSFGFVIIFWEAGREEGLEDRQRVNILPRAKLLLALRSSMYTCRPAI